MQRGSVEIFLGIALIILGILGLKLTDMNYWWAAIALGGVIGSKGGISVSQRARA
jgi:membrane-bound ClpP family serine protease